MAARPVDVAFNLIENTYRGNTTVEVKALDMRPAEQARAVGPSGARAWPPRG